MADEGSEESSAASPARGPMVFNETLVARAAARVTATVTSRTDFSYYHIAAALHHAAESGRIEEANAARPAEGQERQEMLERYWAGVTAAIFSSVAFLESAANELYLDATNPSRAGLQALDDAAKARIATASDKRKFKGDPSLPQDPGEPNVPELIRKCDTVLQEAIEPPAPDWPEVRYDAMSLVYLRNALVHYRSEDVGDDISPDAADTESKRLRARLSGRFPLSPIASDYAFFPKQCLSHGCAAWAARTATVFGKQVYGRLGEPIFLPESLRSL